MMSDAFILTKIVEKRSTNGLQRDHFNILFISNQGNCHLNSINSHNNVEKDKYHLSKRFKCLDKFSEGCYGLLK